MARETDDDHMKRFATELKKQREKYLAHIKASELTLEESAQCFAGWKIKSLIEDGRPESSIDSEGEYRTALVDLESRLPGWKGLSLKRHFGQQ